MRSCRFERARSISMDFIRMPLENGYESRIDRGSSLLPTMSMRERFWNLLCDYRQLLRYLFALAVGLAVLTVISIAAAERGTAEYVISVFNVGVLGLVFVLVGYCLRRCSKRNERTE